MTHYKTKSLQIRHIHRNKKMDHRLRSALCFFAFFFFFDLFELCLLVLVLAPALALSASSSSGVASPPSSSAALSLAAAALCLRRWRCVRLRLLSPPPLLPSPLCESTAMLFRDTLSRHSRCSAARAASASNAPNTFDNDRLHINESEQNKRAQTSVSCTLSILLVGAQQRRSRREAHQGPRAQAQPGCAQAREQREAARHSRSRCAACAGRSASRQWRRRRARACARRRAR